MSQCDECGRSVDKIHRFYKKNNFCHTCYIRVFKKRDCPSCGKLARLYKYDPSAICQKCENNRPCIRCQRIDYPIGKMTEHGPVCNSCSVYFREFQACERCGTLSQKLSRISRFADNLRICPKCATRDHRTCPSCSRYRLLEFEPLSGQMYCKKCLTFPPHPCLSCKQEISAGRGNYCEICSWHRALERKTTKLMSDLEDFNLQTYFKNYTEWLEQRLGAHKTALLISKHIYFFQEISDLWIKQVPSYTVLLQRLRPSGIRKYLLPMQWLSTVHNLQIDIQAKEYCSEIDQLNKLLNSCSESLFSSQILQDYYKVLIKRVDDGKISIRSARLAMKPAAALMFQVSKSRFDMPQEWHIKHYLSEHPGQAASLVGFIVFLKKSYSVNLSYSFIKNSNFLKEARNHKLEREILKLIRAPEESFDLLRWVKVCLKYFHKLNAVHCMEIQLSMINDIDEGLVINFRKENYWIPKRSIFVAYKG
ncbi:MULTISPECIES: hypothetical protein [Acinetobacter calcoaceticus/baumannii complex]|uniref:Uncharacterized protein n=2 Tax=Acinetobacter calcoaceticus/baumannii complex TaxID=909768 RepID=A0A7S8WEX0_ACIBA|nr:MULTISPECIES: hypothetical protein [Acinetobacter calcoaceticus/baumannii complex]EHU1705208.1 hypothetical protein [Acinetobacter baumannii]EKT8678524.1 hypothetical protein [Acinetobacter baumannii]EKU0559438.1 hypothetical protein [Acinetobacter baumannii]EKU2508251.1 hypothetical protein [Acinetobacter baumannii]EKW2951728.1 hypothetical protein [Acinetobacter baumannii]